ncbi:MAG TPA: SDR family NAD(P)-dependent oxidoreductase [Rhizomicrobium sp.]|jgi:short-subunit dehydrogenase|nr:SDR family NAD(P)-dependent oxidoreductase [Rhizomicrobium sp.]
MTHAGGALATVPNILITGASSGIGAALARRYANPGMHLALTARHRERLEAVARECGARGAETTTGFCDIRKAEEICRFVEEVDGRRPITMVIANAGIGGELVIAGQAGESAEVAREIFETNVMGVFNTIVPLLPRFVARGEGHVVIMSSLAAFVGLPDAPAYSASKAAVRTYGQALGPLLAPKNVRVTIVCPGFVDTPMSASLPGRRPLLWSAERAADAIAGGLARGKQEIAFPWQLSALAKLSAHLPQAVIRRLRGRILSHRQ